MSPHAVYLSAYFVLVIALAFAAYLLNVPSAWVVGGAMVLILGGVLVAALKATPVEPAASSNPDDPPASG